MTIKQFPKTFYGFYWLVVKHFPIFFGIIFACGIIRNILGMIFGPLTSKWMMQIFTSATSTDWHEVMVVFFVFNGDVFYTKCDFTFYCLLFAWKKTDDF